MRGGGLRCSGTYGLLSHCYFILEYIIDIVILNSQDTAQYMYFTQYRVSNKDKVATESEPAHGMVDFMDTILVAILIEGTVTGGYTPGLVALLQPSGRGERLRAAVRHKLPLTRHKLLSHVTAC